jgi:hypothetical protein
VKTKKDSKEAKKLYRLKWMIREAKRHIKKWPPIRQTVTTPVITVNLEELPTGMTFEQMDRLILNRGANTKRKTK